MDQLFAKETYAGVRRPLEEATTLPPHAYRDPAFYAREIERVFRRGWVFVGHRDRIAEPGACLALEIAGVPVLLTHGSDGVRRAFANSCRHRGSQLVQGAATCARIVCPYHGWAYELDGSLASAPGMQGARGFRPEENGLVPLRLEEVAGLMWLSLDRETPPLAAWLGDLTGKLLAYGLDGMVQVRRTEYDLACNWKVYVENFLDYYHTPIVHARTLARGNLSVYHRDPPMVETGEGAYVGLYARHTGSAALLAGAAGLPPTPGRVGRAAEGSIFLCVEPSALIACTSDCVWFLEIHPTGPETMRLAVGACFHRETAARADFAERVRPYYERWDLTVEEDNRINEIQQRGVRSPLALAGRVSPLEAATHLFRNRLLDRLQL